ncbi:hypothetical protein BYT27DRAFT_7222310 [Phlegmacium glaucopus]|nr:hypothetical protein BYT27DRAFT_7222310 [Phlegmacium glaucopus]
MAPSPTPVGNAEPVPFPAQSQVAQPVPTAPCCRPLQREGAVILLSQAEQALRDAMLRLSLTPEPVLGKRTHQEEDPLDGDDTEPDGEGSLTTQPQSLSPSIRNVTAATLSSDTALGRQAKLFAFIMSIDNKVDAFQSATPPYQLSKELKTNINNYALAVLLSVNISTYKGDIPHNHILDILKRYRFDLPVGIEHDYANWEKITTQVSYSLTQTRTRVKKVIKDSIITNQNIFSLAQVIVHSTPCRTTVQLCAHVSLMHQIHAECDGCEKYWNLIDGRLAGFNNILKIDQETYGAEESYVIKDTVADEWQQRVDDVVAGTLGVV